MPATRQWGLLFLKTSLIVRVKTKGLIGDLASFKCTSFESFVAGPPEALCRVKRSRIYSFWVRARVWASALTPCRGSASLTHMSTVGIDLLYPGTSETRCRRQLAEGGHQRRLIARHLVMSGRTKLVITGRGTRSVGWNQDNMGPTIFSDNFWHHKSLQQTCCKENDMTNEIRVHVLKKLAVKVK